jgi:hypothetical protein
MARSPIAGAPAIIRAGAYDASASKEMQEVTCNGKFVVLTGTADPLPFPGNVQVNAAGVDAMTLATPLAGEQPAGDDGKTIFIVDLNGAAHTITTTANKIINSKHIATFNGTIGSNCILMAMGGVWVPIALAGVTIS